MLVTAVDFLKKSVDNKEIAEDADAALGGFGIASEGYDIIVALTDGAENVEFNGGFERGGALVGLEIFKDDAWRQWCGRSGIRVHDGISSIRDFAGWVLDRTSINQFGLANRGAKGCAVSH